MRKTMVFTIVAAFFVTWGWMVLHAGANDGLKYWPQWRGPLANGVAPQGNPPLEWSEEKNVKWKVDRDEGTSWSTSLVVQHNGKTQVIVSASNRTRIRPAVGR